MLHLRVITPRSLTQQTVDVLAANPAVTHLVVSENAARKPPGDFVSCDVAREGASGVLSKLRHLGVQREGAIMVENVDISLSRWAKRAEDLAPGEPTDALVWEDLQQSAGEENHLSATYIAFMIVATMIASVGVLLDQPILIVGAMVVGPEFGPLVSLCVGVVARRFGSAARAVGTLALGFAVAMGCTVISTWLLTALGLIDRGMLVAERPLTSFIWQPDALSWVVGFLAGVAGMLSLTSKKSGALVGVLISVTTIPAAANAAVAVAYAEPSEALGSSIQLLINITAIVVAGVLTLAIQRVHQLRLVARTPSEVQPGSRTPGPSVSRRQT